MRRSSFEPVAGFLVPSAGQCNGRSGDDHEGAGDLVEAVDPVAPWSAPPACGPSADHGAGAGRAPSGCRRCVARFRGSRRSPLRDRHRPDSAPTTADPATRRNPTSSTQRAHTTASPDSRRCGRRRTRSGSPDRLPGEIRGRVAQDLAVHPQILILLAQPGQLGPFTRIQRPGLARLVGFLHPRGERTIRDAERFRDLVPAPRDKARSIGHRLRLVTRERLTAWRDRVRAQPGDVRSREVAITGLVELSWRSGSVGQTSVLRRSVGRGPCRVRRPTGRRSRPRLGQRSCARRGRGSPMRVDSLQRSEWG